MKTKVNEVPLVGPRGRKELIEKVQKLEDRITTPNKSVVTLTSEMETLKDYLGITLRPFTSDEEYQRKQYFKLSGQGVLPNITFAIAGDAVPLTVEYSIDQGKSWQTKTFGDGVPVSVGAYGMLIRGKNKNYGAHYYHGSLTPGNYFQADAKCYIGGNIMSLIYGEDFFRADKLADSYAFAYLFKNGTNFQIAKNVTVPFVMPATKLSSYCYYGMFEGCTSITDAPELPAIELTEGCYQNMFKGCSNLVNVPDLPAKILSNECYSDMFNGCSSIITTPRILAEVLASSCCSYMFAQCTGLTSISNLPISSSAADRCFYSMFSNCTNLVNVPELPAQTIGEHSYEFMFVSCTSLVTMPTIKATTLSASSCLGMFKGCTSLSIASKLPATVLGIACYQEMFMNCTSLETAPELPALEIPNNAYHEMFSGCSNLSYIKAMFVTESIYSRYNWVAGVKATGTFVKNRAATWDTVGANGVPEGWTVETANA